MRKNKFKIIAIILIILFAKEIFMMISSSYNNKQMVKSYYNNDTSFNYKTDMIINITKINLEMIVKKANKNFSNLNESLVYYNNNDHNKKIIIFGHSGMGYGTYFNRLDELGKKDVVYIHINKEKITYEFQKKYTISNTDTSILNDDEKGVLLLITCDKKNKGKRLVVKFTKKP